MLEFLNFSESFFVGSLGLSCLLSLKKFQHYFVSTINLFQPAFEELSPVLQVENRYSPICVTLLNGQLNSSNSFKHLLKAEGII